MQIKIKRIRDIIEQKLLAECSVLESLSAEYNEINFQRLPYYSKKTAHERMLAVHRKRNEMKMQAKSIEKTMKRYVFFGGEEFSSDLYDILLKACKTNKPK